ncbi:MAG: hypothetical protein AAB197_03970 [Deltaproteobacteria bacterium]
MQKLLISSIIVFFFTINPYFAVSSHAYEYQLYKNSENFGIVIFPKEVIFTELDQYIQSIKFEPIESGEAVERFGPKGENTTYMMPKEVQDKYFIKKFIIIQVFKDRNLQIGIFDPDWGLTLLPQKFQLDDIKNNIPETLKIFRIGQSTI